MTLAEKYQIHEVSREYDGFPSETGSGTLIERHVSTTYSVTYPENGETKLLTVPTGTPISDHL